MPMFVQKFVVGLVPTNCYLVACEETKDGLIIDPGHMKGEEKDVLHEAVEHHFKIQYIVNTHGHPDHTSGNREIKHETNARIMVHEADKEWLTNAFELFADMVGADHNASMIRSPLSCTKCHTANTELEKFAIQGMIVIHCKKCGFAPEIWISPPADIFLKDGDTFLLGNLQFKVLHTPGHSEGGVCLYCEAEKTLFSGDTLFKGSVGRYDLPIGGSEEKLLQSIKSKLLVLPDETVVYPGHGEQTTIGEEREYNVFLRD
jgi:hydroxyacylglutathione hydrolase